MKIEGEYTAYISDVKRFHLEGAYIKGSCPNCDAEYIRDNYFAYPTINEPFDLTCYCEECDHEWTVKIKIEVKLTLIESS
jgi:hypothetical protein